MIGKRDVVEALGLSDEQAQALGLPESAVVAAGAGSGKTTTLVGAVTYDLLVAGIPAEQLCVCTFTRSAAAGLVSRCGAALSKIAGAQAPDVESLWIGTIDSLCARLLREHALEAGVSPRFRVSDGRQLEALKRDACERALGELSSDDLRLVNELLDVSDLAPLADKIGKAHDQLRQRSRSTPSIWVPPDPDPWPLIAALEDLLAQSEVLNEASGDAIEADIAAARDGDLQSLSTGKWGTMSRELAELREVALERRDAYRQQLLDVRSVAHRGAVEQLLSGYDRHYRELCEQQGALDFAALGERVMQWQQDHPGRIFERIYIDEAQDTSPSQHRILRALAKGPIIQVGDEAQSIYSFRQADVESFRRASANQLRIELADNYRSRPEVLAAINGLCSNVEQLRDRLIVMQSAGPRSEQDPLPAGQPAVEVLGLVEEGGSFVSTLAEARAAVPAILESARERGISLSEICVLAPTNSDVSDFADAFREHGVPALALQSKGLLKQSECMDIFHYLGLLADPTDEEALFRVLSSPFCGLSDADLSELGEQRQDLIRRIKSKRGIARLETSDPDYPPMLEIVAAELPEFHRELVESMSRGAGGSVAARLRHGIDAHRYDLALELLDPTGAKMRNVERMIWVIEGIERDLDGPNPRAIHERLKDELSLNGGEGQDARMPEGIEAVRVMTTHRAKGDEFKLVVAARLGKRINKSRDRLRIDEQGRLGISLPGLKRGKSADSIAAACDAADDARKLEESSRILYVALTRAQEHLIMLASAPKRSGEVKWQGVFADLFDTSQLSFEPGAESWIQLPHGGRVRARGLTPAPDPGRSSPARLGQLSESTAEDIDGPLPVSEPELPEIALSQISYSSLAAWRRCSMRRHLELELGLGEQRGRERDEDAGANTGAREFGVRIHKALEHLDWESGTEQIEPLIERAGIDPERRGEAAEMISDLLGSELAGRIKRAHEISPEAYFQLSGTRICQGKIDLLAFIDDGALVCDWKSGEDPEQIFSADYSLQRRIYALAALRSPQEPAWVEVISYELAGGDDETEIWSRAEIDSLEAEVGALIEEIMSAKPLPATEDEAPFCAGCPGLSRICPVSKRTDRPAAGDSACQPAP